MQFIAMLKSAFIHFKPIIFIGFKYMKAPLLNFNKLLPLLTPPSGNIKIGNLFLPYSISSILYLISFLTCSLDYLFLKST